MILNQIAREFVKGFALNQDDNKNVKGMTWHL